MSEKTPLARKDLKVGMKVPWNIFDLEGRKLLAKGQEIRSDKMLDEMCQYVLFHDVPNEQHNAIKSTQGKLNVFDITAKYIKRIEKIYSELENQNPECIELINNLAKDILVLCIREPDGILGVCHVKNEYHYTHYHSLQCAYISVMIARRAGFSDYECYCLSAAAILANVSMQHTQEKLTKQTEPLTQAQNNIILKHPEKSVELLRSINYDNENVLDIIHEHHERCDGSGYPNGYKRENICRGALILGIADSYGAMVSTENYHKQFAINEVLQYFFKDKGSLYETHFSLLLIKVLTVFPPGCFVKLTNGETAIVVFRGKMSPMEPYLKSVLGKNGEEYANPLIRDLSIHKFDIQTICVNESEKPLNYSQIWGYTT
ncbi:MAG: HD domain-containing protein [Gammaproteobacteria bacterium]|nr:HD domain-containing protein [Gammaproteobacteria bacterium]